MFCYKLNKQIAWKVFLLYEQDYVAKDDLYLQKIDCTLNMWKISPQSYKTFLHYHCT